MLFRLDCIVASLVGVGLRRGGPGLCSETPLAGRWIDAQKHVQVDDWVSFFPDSVVLIFELYVRLFHVHCEIEKFRCVQAVGHAVFPPVNERQFALRNRSMIAMKSRYCTCEIGHAENQEQCKTLLVAYKAADCDYNVP